MVDINFKKFSPDALTREIFGWTQDPKLRAVIPSLRSVNSFKQQKSYIAECLERGDQWFIITHDFDDIGLVKWRYENNQIVIFSLMIAKLENRRTGVGRRALEFSIEKITKDPLIKFIKAEVMENNDASIKFFLNFGFKEVNISVSHGEYHKVFILEV